MEEKSSRQIPGVSQTALRHLVTARSSLDESRSYIRNTEVKQRVESLVYQLNGLLLLLRVEGES